ncbi:hypothetical protein JCM10049v2_007057 [Rhodotorula toruloides]
MQHKATKEHQPGTGSQLTRAQIVKTPSYLPLSSSTNPALPLMSSVPLPRPGDFRTGGYLIGTRRPVDCEAEGVFVKRIQWGGRDIIVKYGISVSSGEADVMRMIKANTSIPVPKVYGVVHEEATGETFIYMELVDGITLAEAWSNLSPLELAAIQRDFSAYIAELATLEPPHDVVLGACNNKLDTRVGESCHALLVRKPEPVMRTIEDFAGWIRSEMDRRRGALLRLPPSPANLDQLLTSSVVGFVHADLHGENILIKNGRIAAIIDWELTGWLPRIVEPLALVGYIKKRRYGCPPAMEGLLSTFDLEPETREGLLFVHMALNAGPDSAHWAESW